MIIDSEGPEVSIIVSRPDNAVRVDFANGIGIGAFPGDNIRPLASRAGYRVKYSCKSGGCGTCEQKAEDDERGKRYIRACVSQVPLTAKWMKVAPSDRVQ